MDVKETVEARIKLLVGPGATLQGGVDPVETTIAHNSTPTIHGHTMLAVINGENNHNVCSNDLCRFDNKLFSS